MCKRQANFSFLALPNFCLIFVDILLLNIAQKKSFFLTSNQAEYFFIIVNGLNPGVSVDCLV